MFLKWKAECHRCKTSLALETSWPKDTWKNPGSIVCPVCDATVRLRVERGP